LTETVGYLVAKVIWGFNAYLTDKHQKDEKWETEHPTVGQFFGTM
jgi:hypothetical protein